MATDKADAQTRAFIEWLDAELDQRGWNDAELARRGDFYATSLTHIRKGRRKPGIKLVRAISVALGISADTAAAKAGLVPDYIDNENALRERDIRNIRRILSELDETARRSYIQFGESLVRSNRVKR